MKMTDKLFSYKGYCGSLELSVDDDCLFGQILFVRDLVTYEAQQIGELRAAFEGAVDYYLEKCGREGVRPDKPFSGTINVRFSADLHRAASVEAARAGKSLNEFVKECVEDSINEAKHSSNACSPIQGAAQRPIIDALADMPNVAEDADFDVR